MGFIHVRVDGSAAVVTVWDNRVGRWYGARVGQVHFYNAAKYDQALADALVNQSGGGYHRETTAAADTTGVAVPVLVTDAGGLANVCDAFDSAFDPGPNCAATRPLI